MMVVGLVAGCVASPTGEIVPEPTSLPTSPERREWVEVTAHPCAIDTDGGVTCWGSVRGDGELGHGGVLEAQTTPGAQLVTSWGIVYSLKPGEVLSTLFIDGQSSWATPPPVPLEQSNITMGIPTQEDALFHWEGPAWHLTHQGRGWYLVSENHGFAVDRDNTVAFGLGARFSSVPSRIHVSWQTWSVVGRARIRPCSRRVAWP